MAFDKLIALNGKIAKIGGAVNRTSLAPQRLETPILWLKSTGSVIPSTSWSDYQDSTKVASAPNGFSVVANAINGLPSIALNGINQYLNVNVQAGIASTATVHIVFRMNTIQASKVILSNNNGSSPTIELRTSGDGLSLIFESSSNVMTLGMDPTGWNIFSICFNGSGSTGWSYAYINGIAYNPTLTNTATISNTSNLIIGANNASGYSNFAALEIVELFISNQSHIHSKKQVMFTYFANQYKMSPKYEGSFIICDGNSLTAPGPTTCYPVQLKDLLGYKHSILNLGVGGKTTQNLNSDSPQRVFPWYYSAYFKNIAVIWEYTNDIVFGATAASAQTNMQTYAKKFKDAGYFTIVLSIIVRGQTAGVTTPPTFEADRNTVNNALRSQFNVATSDPLIFMKSSSVNWADMLIDVGGDAIFNNTASFLNTTYYYDQTHLTTFGYGIIAQYVKRGLSIVLKNDL